MKSLYIALFALLILAALATVAIAQGPGGIPLPTKQPSPTKDNLIVLLTMEAGRKQTPINNGDNGMFSTPTPQGAVVTITQLPSVESPLEPRPTHIPVTVPVFSLPSRTPTPNNGYDVLSPIAG